ncbi:unnamed protein product [Parajaminaea phylloscopi]
MDRNPDRRGWSVLRPSAPAGERAGSLTLVASLHPGGLSGRALQTPALAAGQSYYHSTSRAANMLVVGLTGGIASGKSTVSSLLVKKHGIPLIDLDVLAREVVHPKDPSGTLQKLVAHFGPEILNEEDGTLNRAALGRLAFGSGNDRARKTLNRITHTAIRKRMAWLILRNYLSGKKVTVVDTPLLIEAGLWKWFGLAVVVWCSPEDQLSRMLSRDSSKGLTQSDAESRLESQLALNKKLPYADIVLDNSSALTQGSSASKRTDAGASEALEAQVSDMVRSWRSAYSGLFGTLYWLAQWLCPPFALLTASVCIISRRAAVSKRLSQAEDSDQQASERRRSGSSGDPRAST